MNSSRFNKASKLVAKLLESPVVDPLTPENYTKKLHDISGILDRKGIPAAVINDPDATPPWVVTVMLPDDSELLFGVNGGTWGHAPAQNPTEGYSGVTQWSDSGLAEDEPMADVIEYIVNTVHSNLDTPPDSSARFST